MIIDIVLVDGFTCRQCGYKGDKLIIRQQPADSSEDLFECPDCSVVFSQPQKFSTTGLKDIRDHDGFDSTTQELRQAFLADDG